MTVMNTPDASPSEPQRRLGIAGRIRVRAERVVLVTGMSLAAVNLCTGAPLLGLWVGSRLTGGNSISMGAVAAVGATIFAVSLALIRVLGALGARHDQLLGRSRVVRRHVPWLRSMSGARPNEPGSHEPALSALDYILIGTVVLCLLAFEFWFFFYSSSPIDQRSGR